MLFRPWPGVTYGRKSEGPTNIYLNPFTTTKGKTMPRAGKPKEGKQTMMKAEVKNTSKKKPSDKSYAKTTPKKKKKSGSA